MSPRTSRSSLSGPETPDSAAPDSKVVDAKLLDAEAAERDAAARRTWRGSFLLVVRSGGVWGIANRAVRGIGGSSGEYRIRLDGQEESSDLLADEVLGVVEDLTIWPAATVLRRYWPGLAGGIAVHAGAPLVIIDPHRPPGLMLEQGEVSDVDGR